jgi:hypothetical protein
MALPEVVGWDLVPLPGRRRLGIGEGRCSRIAGEGRRLAARQLARSGGSAR